jgi:ABC-type sulfate/molybdate transport systems ATPase subunit
MLSIAKLSFSRPNAVILDSVSIDIKAGSHVSFMGQSGSGKSTLLQLIYGLHEFEGQISWQGVPLYGPSRNLLPGHAQMKYLAQDLGLMPYLTVAENIAYYLSAHTPALLVRRTNELLDMIEMQALAHRKVKSLSGGQQQLVALARALAQEPEVLLLDEPFGQIDTFKKNRLRRNIFGHARNQGITVLVATHDPEDVLPFSDTLVLLKDQGIFAQGDPVDLYRNPKIKAVAELFGDVNEIPIKLLKPYAKIDMDVLIYPHEFYVSETSGLAVRIKARYYLGSYFLYEAQTMIDLRTLFFNAPLPFEEDQEVFLNIPLEILTERIGKRPAP